MRRRSAPSRPDGFTLLEMMVVVFIVGTLLLLVPPNLAGVGARGELEETANTFVASLAAAREQAILDGYEVHLEFGNYQDSEGRRQGFRWHFTSVPPARSAAALRDDPERAQQLREQRGRERQWLKTPWQPLPRGVRIVAVSEEAQRWEAIEDGAYQAVFLPDGHVQRGFALRLRSNDLEVSEENRTMTVLVNPLTAQAWAVDGLAEMPPRKDHHEFQ